MRKFVFAAFLLLAALPVRAETTSDLLKHQTQELFDAVSNGDAKVWDKYLDTTVAFLDENGVLADRCSRRVRATYSHKCSICEHFGQRAAHFRVSVLSGSARTIR